MLARGHKDTDKCCSRERLVAHTEAASVARHRAPDADKRFDEFVQQFVIDGEGLLEFPAQVQGCIVPPQSGGEAWGGR